MSGLVILPSQENISIKKLSLFLLFYVSIITNRGKEGQPQQYLVRATFSSFSPPRNPRPSNIILFKSLQINYFFENLATLGKKTLNFPKTIFEFLKKIKMLHEQCFTNKHLYGRFGRIKGEECGWDEKLLWLAFLPSQNPRLT